MSRRKREPDSSLFPFLSVLACVIGTLTLMIAALAVGQVAESLAEGAELDPTQIEQLAAERAELAALEERIQSAEQLGEELAAARAELRALGVDPEQRESDRRRAVRARATAAQLARRLQELEQQESQLSGSIQGIETDLSQDSEDDENRPIRILPQGTAPALRPFFVECRAEGVRIYSDNLGESWYLEFGVVEDDARFAGFLQRVRTVRDGSVMFLIRPDGIETYMQARYRADNAYVRHAKLPLPSQGALDFRL
jgi:hypothetical protein